VAGRSFSILYDFEPVVTIVGLRIILAQARRR
jgi:hypothetical protein